MELAMHRYDDYNEYLCFWCLDKTNPPQYLDEGNLSLQESKPHANTAAWARPKWHVAELRTLSLLFSSKPILCDM